MTVKSRKFPLHLSSLGANAEPRSHGIRKVETPQTATQNVHRHVTEKKPVIYKDAHKNTHKDVYKEGPPKKILPSADGPRRAMVERLIKQGIKDEVVLAAMGAVPRHQFVEQGLISQAYIDASLPIGHQQTISQPYIVARMIEVMRNGRDNGKKLNTVLEIGTGCGYQAAVLAQVCENVYSIERIKGLHELAKKNLRALRIANLRLHYGDGMLGLPQVAPFDGIILAAAGMQIPDALLQQLAIGGRLIAPVGEKQQVLQLIERTGQADWNQSVLEECYFVPLCPGTI